VVISAPFPAFTKVMFQSIIPEQFWWPFLYDEVVAWLNDHVPDPMTRKLALLDYCKYHGVTFTVQMAVDIGAEHLPPP